MIAFPTLIESSSLGTTRPANTPDSEAALISRCLNNDQAAWNELIERYGRLVYSIPRRYGMCEADADDVFQSVFSILHQRMADIENSSRLSAWLITTTHRECWRIQKSRRLSTEALAPLADSDSPPEAEVARWEQQHLLHEAMRRLSTAERQLIWALFFDSTSPDYAQIAARLGRKHGSIGPTRARIFKKLQRSLEELGFRGEAELMLAQAAA